MNGTEQFQAALLKLTIEHPDKVVWAGGWEGKLTLGWLDIPRGDVIRAKAALRAVMEDEGFEVMLSNVDHETLRLEKNHKTPEHLEAEEMVADMLLSFNRAVAENPDKLVIIASVLKDSSNSKGEGVLTVICAPDISDLQKMKERGWKALCYSWKGEHYEMKEGKVIRLKGLPMMH